MTTSQTFGMEKISKILMKIAPPVMLAQLIQALYNIIDSLFVGRYAETGLTALSIVYPIQLLMIAFAVGLGVGISTVMSAKLGVGKQEEANAYAGVGTPLILVVWLLFAVISWAIMPVYARLSSESEAVIHDVIVYGRIVCIFSFGLFLESIWTKVLQAEGNMKLPMAAQILGALTNIALDPILIFGMFGLPKLGIAGAAIATVAGQIAAALVVFRSGFRKSPSIQVYQHHIAKIFRLGVPNILMQSAYTFYILGLNLILTTFSDHAVTALGLYYKWQTFFFIPLGSMQTCIVPIISYNYATGNIERCRKTLSTAVIFGVIFMIAGAFCFELFPVPMLRIFTNNESVVDIGRIGFRIIGISFIPQVTSLIFPVFFQAIGAGLKSSLLTLIRTLVLFVPLGFVFSRFGLNWFWLTFPVTELVTTAVGSIFYMQFLRQPQNVEKYNPDAVSQAVIHPSRPGVIITIAREHGSSGKQIGKLVAEKLGISFYYKELTALAAQESGLAQEFIADMNENSPNVLYDLYMSNHVVRTAMLAQCRIIQKIAESGSCVIVGRAADYVLKDLENVVKIFIYAPDEYRVQRIMDVYQDTEEEAIRNIRHSDYARAAYYKNISGHDWGDRHCYNLMIDSSCGIEKSATCIIQYIKEKEAAQKKSK